jgi:hypothetical protein
MLQLKVKGAKSRTTENTESTEFHRDNERFDDFLCVLCVPRFTLWFKV